MLQKGTQEYKKAQQIANQISRWAAAHWVYNNSAAQWADTQLGWFLNDVKKVGGFAAQVAETIEKSMKLYNADYVAKMSSKQAWFLACAAVENGIQGKGLDDETESENEE